MIEHSNCNNCGQDQAWKWMKGKGHSAPRKMCWDMTIEMKDGTQIELLFVCESTGTFEDQNCKIDESRSKIKDLSSKLSFRLTEKH